jgi:hypothetical protein
MARIKSDDDTAPEQAAGPDTTDKDNIMAVRQDTIAQSMWDDYQQRILGRHLDADCQGTPVAYPPVTGQGRLNGCGLAKAG